MSEHKDTSAIVTGGGRGLGLAIARRLIDEGCRKLVIVDRDAASGTAAAAELATRGAEAHFLPLDMGDVAAVQGLAGAAVDRIGPVNALVNAAASTDRGSILDTSPELFDRILAINTRGPFFAIQGFAKHCIEQGHPGGVVNILSIVVHGGTPFLAPYVASKAALLALTKNAANALTRHRIRVNGVNVGWMDTPGEDEIQRKYHGRGDGWLAEVEAQQPFGMLVKPEHIARQVALFLNPASGVVTGSVLDWDQQVIGAYPDTNEL